MERKLSQPVNTLKMALHHMSLALATINSLKPNEILDLFEDMTDPSHPRDRFQFISTCLLNLGSNVSDARMILVNLGTYSTIEEWVTNEKKEIQKAFLPPEKETGEKESEGEEGV